MTTRRQFLAASAAALAGPALAIDPVKRPPGKPQLKLSLAAYSFRQALDLKKPRMTLFDFIDLGATLPLDAVELTSYYFAEETDAYLDKLKAHAAAKKLAISGVPVGNDFCQRDEAKRKKAVEHVKTWTRHAARLGAPTVRIFAGNVPKGDTLGQAQKRVVAAVEECCEVAEKLGVTLALENHGGITATPEQLLALVKPVKSPALGVNIDTGNFHTADPYADVAKIAPYGVVCQVKTELSRNGKWESADLGRMVRILKDANYHGYVALEYEAKEDPRTAVPRYIKELRKVIG
ncbi:MAG TPA: sugar phosphate isomerase/epimerase family protein [Fimbriiglobus sp.]|nr:sugar phosphate isomerase/epimerase family protein [Fimbriiglobus sp.]